MWPIATARDGWFRAKAKRQVVMGSPSSSNRSFLWNNSRRAAAVSGAILRSRRDNFGAGANSKNNGSAGSPGSCARGRLGAVSAISKVHFDEIRQIADPEFGHEAGAMQLHGLGTDAQHVGDALV